MSSRDRAQQVMSVVSRPLTGDDPESEHSYSASSPIEDLEDEITQRLGQREHRQLGRMLEKPLDAEWAAAPALVVHHLVLTPNTRSQRLKAPSAMGAGSWIQGTRWEANPGARRSAKL
jgi:hypothetical protein